MATVTTKATPAKAPTNEALDFVGEFIEGPSTTGARRRGTTFTLDEMRVVLSDSIRDIRESDASAVNVNAISNAVGKILSSVKLEIDYYRLIGKTPDIPMLNTGNKKAS